ncbi:hypothetical protein ON010_g15367 [Phytophthora cinnamomi]|nr:hypothetical protein ON010_g15367 [Phytophthora cinnamomi]
MPRRCTAISAGEKLRVLSAWAECGDIRAVITTFYTGLDSFAQERRRKLIYQWRKRHGHIEAACKTVKGRRQKKARHCGCGTALSMDAEKALVVWINDLRGEDVPISTVMLDLQALDVAATYGVANFDRQGVGRAERAHDHCRLFEGKARRARGSGASTLVGELASLSLIDRSVGQVDDGKILLVARTAITFSTSRRHGPRTNMHFDVFSMHSGINNIAVIEILGHDWHMCCVWSKRAPPTTTATAHRAALS